VATIQGAIMLALAGLVGVPYNPVMLLVLLVEMVLTAFALTAFGVMLAARISDVQSFQVITQLFVLPMFFLSGAVFPVTRLPGWLAALSKIDPLSYAVDPLRKEVFSYLTMPPAIRSTFDPGISWGSWHLPVYFEVTLVAVAAVVMLATEIRQFSKTT
jgi:ABC-2 type transport system permease protein